MPTWLSSAGDYRSPRSSARGSLPTKVAGRPDHAACREGILETMWGFLVEYGPRSERWVAPLVSFLCLDFPLDPRDES